jgi:predicted enzyme related to lactoylglutathione lyase
MGERTSHDPGTISWTDLATTDADAAKAFYSGLFGWEYDDQPAGEGVIYSMAQLGGRAAAAISPQQPDEAAQGIPPHWNVYVTVADVDAASAAAGEAGGTVLAGPFDVMEVGRMSVISDPAGAILCLWQAKESIGAEIVNVPGALAWADTATTDPAASQAFYSAVLGWSFQKMSEDPPYWVIFNGERSNGGMTKPPPGVPSNWFPYFGVDDVDATIESARAAGGNPFIGPIDVPNGGRFALIMDPQGAAFAVLSSDNYDD